MAQSNHSPSIRITTGRALLTSFKAEVLMYANPEELFGGTGKLLALIELIYRAVDDASLWPIVMEQVSAVLHGEGICAWTFFPENRATNIVTVARMDPEALVPYAQYYATRNVLAHRCDALYQDGRARFSDRAVPDVEFEKTEFCNDYFHPNGMHYSIGVKVPLGELPPAYIACMRPRSGFAFEDREATVLETLVPHLRRALTLHLQFSQLRLNAEGLQSGLDAFGHAVFGLNAAGRVVLSNRQAEKIAAAGDGLKLVNGRLTASYTKENTLLQQLLQESVASGSRVGLASGGSALLSRRSGEPLRVTVSPLQCRLPDSYAQLTALVFVNAPEIAPLSRSIALRALYGLTPAEARIADLLASGNEVAEIAAKSGITLETARFHVKRLLAKTGTRRQAELMRLMLSLPGSVEPNSLL